MDIVCVVCVCVYERTEVLLHSDQSLPIMFTTSGESDMIALEFSVPRIQQRWFRQLPHGHQILQIYPYATWSRHWASPTEILVH